MSTEARSCTQSRQACLIFFLFQSWVEPKILSECKLEFTRENSNSVTLTSAHLSALDCGGNRFNYRITIQLLVGLSSLVKSYYSKGTGTYISDPSAIPLFGRPQMPFSNRYLKTVNQCSGAGSGSVSFLASSIWIYNYLCGSGSFHQQEKN
jgi:hypothetical protein